MALIPGQSLKEGRYTIVASMPKPSSVGRALYTAVDETVPRIVIVGEAHGSAEVRAALARRLRRVRDLGIKGLQRILDVFEQSETLYYVYEWLSGESVAEIIGGKKRPEVEHAIAWIDSILETLIALKKLSLVAAELRPDIIHIDPTWRTATLIDPAGLRELGQNSEPNNPLPFNRFYSAPEQNRPSDTAMHEAFSSEMEVYAAGACLYYLLAGREPPESLLLKNDEVPLTLALPDKSANTRKLEGVVLHAMSIDPSRRYGRAADFHTDMRQFPKESTMQRMAARVREARGAHDSALAAHNEAQKKAGDLARQLQEAHAQLERERAQAALPATAQAVSSTQLQRLRKQRRRTKEIAKSLRSQRDVAQAEVIALEAQRSITARKAALLYRHQRRRVAIARALKSKLEEVRKEAVRNGAARDEALAEQKKALADLHYHPLVRLPKRLPTLLYQTMLIGGGVLISSFFGFQAIAILWVVFLVALIEVGSLIFSIVWRPYGNPSGASWWERLSRSGLVACIVFLVCLMLVHLDGVSTPVLDVGEYMALALGGCGFLASFVLFLRA